MGSSIPYPSYGAKRFVQFCLVVVFVLLFVVVASL